MIEPEKELSPSEILDFLLKLEEDYPVTKWKLFGFHIWPILRISLGMKLSLQSFIAEDNQLVSSNSSVISESVQSIVNSICNSFNDSDNNQSLNKKYDTVFLNVSSTRYFKLGEKWFNPFSDSFISFFEKANISSLVLEYPDIKERKIPRYRPSKYIGTELNMMNINVLIQKYFEKIDISGLEKFDSFLNEVNLPADFFFKKILRVINYSVYFQKILKKTNSSLCIIEGYYSYIAMGFLLAAHKQNIKCIDIQHGVQSENDFLYSNWSAIPETAYELLPDIFWCWSEVEKQNVDKWIHKTNGKFFSIAGGNPVLEVNEEDEYVNSVSEEINSKSESGNVINVLYTHQASFELSDLLVNAIKNSPDNWKWWIRFHPQYPDAKNKVMYLLDRFNFPNIVLDKVSEFPLPLLLKNMDLHVTEFSSTVLEAEMLGVPSILLSKSGKYLFNIQIVSGIAKYCEDLSTFFANADVLLNSKEKLFVNNNNSNFRNGIDMMKKLIGEKKKN